MNRLPKLILAAALLGLLAVSASQALAADVVLQPAVYTTRDGVPVLTAPAVTTPVVTTWGIMAALTGASWLLTRRLALRPTTAQTALELVGASGGRPNG